MLYYICFKKIIFTPVGSACLPELTCVVITDVYLGGHLVQNLRNCLLFHVTVSHFFTFVNNDFWSAW